MPFFLLSFFPPKILLNLKISSLISKKLHKLNLKLDTKEWMKMSKRKQMPQSPEEYKVKYVFNEEEINLNEIIKQCFEMQLSNLLTK